METDFSNKAVLVTGGLGFIGSHLVEALVVRKGRVTVFDSGQSGTKNNLPAAVASKVVIRTSDVRDKKAVSDAVKVCRPHYVFHLAANASVPASVDNPAYDFEVNSAGTFKLLNAMRACGSQARMIVASSGAVYGEPKAMPIRESAVLAPISPYGASKVGAEAECRVFHRVYGVDVVIARIFNTYGPRMPRFVVLDFLRKLQRNQKTLEILGDGRQVRDFNYVDDTVQGLLTLAERGKAGESYNLASGRAYSVTQVARHLLRILGLDKRTTLAFTGESWVGDAQHWEVDISKIKRLGYRPMASLDVGLKRVVEWFQANNPVSSGGATHRRRRASTVRRKELTMKERKV